MLVEVDGWQPVDRMSTARRKGIAERMAHQGMLRRHSFQDSYYEAPPLPPLGWRWGEGAESPKGAGLLPIEKPDYRKRRRLELGARRDMTTAGENGPTTWVDDDASPRLGLLLLPLAFVGLGASSPGDRLSGAFGPPYSEITSCLVE